MLSERRWSCSDASTRALAAGLAELAGGVLFALGVLTPLVSALMIAVMVACAGVAACG